MPQKTYILTGPALEAAKRVSAEARKIVEARLQADVQYKSDIAALVSARQRAYVEEMAEYTKALDAVMLQSAKDICENIGIPYNETTTYALETGFVEEHGHAYMIPLENTRRPDSPVVEDTSQQPPPGTRLN